MPAKRPTPALTVPLETARAFWLAGQGLARPAAADPAAVVGATGWVRTLGGIDVYLALRARLGAPRRAEIDGAVAAGELRVVPAVRGCIYLVGAADVPLTMALAADLGRPRTERDLAKVGSGWAEIEAVAAEVTKALRKGPLTTAALRKALPADVLRSFGEAGKKVGLSSPLPVALRELEFRDEIQRKPVGDRLDTERYDWALAPKGKCQVPAGREGRLAAVVRRFFEFFAPATTKELVTWVGVSQRDAKAAMARLPLVPVAIAGRPGEAWILEDELAALAAASPAEPDWTFLPFEDNLLTVHGGPGVLVDEEYHDEPVKAWGSLKPTTLGAAKHVHQRLLLCGERLVGFWEHDANAGEVVTATFADVPAGAKKKLDAERWRLATFVGAELGHARSFSLDTDESVRQRAAALRARA